MSESTRGECFISPAPGMERGLAWVRLCTLVPSTHTHTHTHTQGRAQTFWLAIAQTCSGCSRTLSYILNYGFSSCMILHIELYTVLQFQNHNIQPLKINSWVGIVCIVERNNQKKVNLANSDSQSVPTEQSCSGPDLTHTATLSSGPHTAWSDGTWSSPVYQMWATTTAQHYRMSTKGDKGGPYMFCAI